MATSNSFNFSVTAYQVIVKALQFNKVLATGETVNSDDLATALQSLNMMVKQWSGNFDFAPGLKAFSRKTGYIFLQKNQSEYTLGPSGDNASLSYTTTTMRIAGAATDTTIEVTSTSGMTAADYIGIELDSGSIYWTTISSITDGDTLVIPAPGLSGTSGIGKRIFAYTTKLIRPLYIENAVIRDMDNLDTQIYPMDRGYYEQTPNKYATGQPSRYLYENYITNGKLIIDTYPDDVTNVIRAEFIAPAEDYDDSANDIAYPQEWYLPLAIGLSKLLAPEFSVPWDSQQEDIYINTLAMARSSYAETTEMYFQPGLE